MLTLWTGCVPGAGEQQSYEVSDELPAPHRAAWSTPLPAPSESKNPGDLLRLSRFRHGADQAQQEIAEIEAGARIIRCYDHRARALG